MSKMNDKLFGTDGIRGIANIEPMTAETALKLGRAAAYVFAIVGCSGRPNPKRKRRSIVLGRDTRISGYMLESAVISGITSLGVDVLLVGTLPTPGVAYITRFLQADAGIVLSASHNPYKDNGIKFFRYDGYKLDSSTEACIERFVFLGTGPLRPTASDIGRVIIVHDALTRYIEHATRSFPCSYTLEQLRIVIDCANGAAYQSSPSILRALGAHLHILHDSPNGININKNSGSNCPEAIQKIVLKARAHIGVAHDGDADRVLFCDEKGDLLDGDEVMAIVALDLLHNHLLAKKTLVATIMSNIGLDEMIQQHGGKVIRTKVGDRHLIEAMLRNGLNVGGEQSGHLIFRDYTTTGDGIISALQVFRIMIASGKPLSELKRCLEKYTQVQRHLKVRRKPPIDSLVEVQTLIEDAQIALKDKGRVLLRYSGTESKVRLLVEGHNELQVSEIAQRIADALYSAIGA